MNNNGSGITCEVWNRVISYGDLLNLNISYLTGRINNTPWHDCNICSETYTILPELIKINKLGLLTTDSQPGTCIYGGFSGHDHLRYDEEQRGYIECFVYKSIIDRLVRALLKTGEVIIILMNRDTKHNDIYIPDIKMPAGLFMNNDMILLTRDRYVNNVETKRENGNQWRHYTKYNTKIFNDDMYKLMPDILDKHKLIGMMIIKIKMGETNIGRLTLRTLQHVINAKNKN